ncbi:hypothetical protein [uncultured Clostridium sp.]|uniref:hypothetical protein n=1 Tax=uncultured Clostridium sp. TaxID=59620 RepID=UPI0028F01675|nr:hypothetical protein [uncultured Clostridium sp.]
MRKTIVILVTIILFLLGECSNQKVIRYDYTYKGENESWTAEYRVNGTSAFIEKDNKTSYEENGSIILTVTYKNDISDLSSVKHLEIACKGRKEVYDLDDNDQLNQKTFILKSSGVGAIGDKDEIIDVNINVNGKTQTIELKK